MCCSKLYCHFGAFNGIMDNLDGGLGEKFDDVPLNALRMLIFIGLAPHAWRVTPVRMPRNSVYLAMSSNRVLVSSQCGEFWPQQLSKIPQNAWVVVSGRKRVPGCDCELCQE